MLKAYKYRIYPNQQQQELIQKTFGCCRFVYNYMLTYKQEIYKKENKNLSKLDCDTYCNRILKNKYPWLKEPDKYALTNSIFNMCDAYQRFFKKQNRFPKFKSKHNNYKSYKTNKNNFKNIEINFENNKLKLPKLKWVKIKISRKFEGQIKSVTISQIPGGKYYASILVETEYKKLPQTNNQIGLDLGIKDFCITSNGVKYENPKFLNKYQKRLAKLQRQLAHKQKGSKNYNKQRIKVAKYHENIVNIRKDYLHKISHEIISENQVIVSENLDVKNMLKNHNLARSIVDVSWHEFIRQLEYKAKWNDRQYIKIDRFFASSQICSNCGFKNTKVKDLSIREWQCSNCGSIHDRDINAAKNILKKGLKLV